MEDVQFYLILLLKEADKSTRGLYLFLNKLLLVPSALFQVVAVTKLTQKHT